MNISQAAKRTELSAVTLRYYEKVGLIPPIARKNGSVRDYALQDIEWIKFIKCMRSAGLSIEALVSYTALFIEGQDTEEQRQQILQDERKSLQEKYQELGATLQRLDQKIEFYELRQNEKMLANGKI
ncbi:MerR family transcriptional regulator [Enterococcus sp. HY326]|uniref:MerR family transcriptional regulator n=1 Tax=Enterococcus sp. HY326 TaxID=2971265 RepID=UPI0022404EE2|nr:MerR family transcriptional regulator [Enterococcus sp. HY326]